MAKSAKPKTGKFELPIFEVSEPPKSVTRTKMIAFRPFREILEKVRALNGKSALILQSQRAGNRVAGLKELYPDFVFVSRSIYNRTGSSKLVGVWARLKVPNPPIPDAPSPNPLTAPDLG